VFASPTVGDAQQHLRDVLDVLGMATGYELREVASAVEGLFGVDVLQGDPLAGIGVDLQGSWAMFSEELNPTIVVHLAAPDRMTAFLDGRRKRGLVTESEIVDATEVVSAKLAGGVTLRWAIAGDWMWIHLGLPFAHDDGTSWFAASHGPHGDGWTGTWSWAERAAGGAAGLIGFLDLHGAIARVVARAPDAIACAKLIEPVGRVALALDGDGHRVVARIAVDVGSTAGIRSWLLPAPAGWDATAAHAAIAAQWNLDLSAARPALAPCFAMAAGQLAMADAISARTARGMLLGFDPQSMSGSGAVALDITNATFFQRQLDQIPLRRALERARTFGAHKGFSIAIPFSVTVEYVLEPKLALAAVGEGLLAKLVAPGPPDTRASAPIVALDIAPPAMSAAAWETLLHAFAEQSFSGSPGPVTRRAVKQLMRWRDAHLAVTVEATQLIVTASANRR
jgi:hypothetical protein